MILNNYNPNTTDNPREMFIQVSKDDEIIGPISRKDCHNETIRPWHRTTLIFLFSPDGNLYFSQRSMNKDTAPGKWTASTGGHVNFGQEYKEAAEIEVREELGLKSQLQFQDKINVDHGAEREIIALFTGVTATEPKPNKDEIIQIKLFDYDKIQQQLDNGSFELSSGSKEAFQSLRDSGKLEIYRNSIIKK
ncbi:NUDIX domain-containing protein [Candidatus Dojkabacteria bacterium]|nr:NUDIX domain-containing protein [Candidatus Dojkabacteria bacterium]